MAGVALPVTDEKAGLVLALPMSPYLSEADQDLILAAIAVEMMFDGAKAMLPGLG